MTSPFIGLLILDVINRFMFGHRVVIYFIMQSLLELRSKNLLCFPLVRPGPNIRFASWWRGARWLSGRVSDSGARGPGFETYRRRVVSLSKTLYSPKVLVNYPGSDGSVPTWLKIVDWDVKPQHNQPTKSLLMGPVCSWLPIYGMSNLAHFIIKKKKKKKISWRYIHSSITSYGR